TAGRDGDRPADGGAPVGRGRPPRPALAPARAGALGEALPVSDGRLAASIFTLALLVGVVAWTGAAIFGTDGCHFLLMADWISAGRFDDALRIAYHPGYPLLIAAAKIPLRDTVLAGHAVAALFGAAAVVPLFRMIRRFFGRPAAFIPGILYAFHPVLL